MLFKEATKMPVSHSQSWGQLADRALNQRAFGDEPESAGDRGRGPQPGRSTWRGFWAATQTWAESRLRCCRGAGKEAAVLPLRRSGWADRPTVDPGREYACEDTSVEADVATAYRAVADVIVEVHAYFIPLRTTSVRRFSDMVLFFS